MSGFSGIKTFGFAQSREERQVSLSYYKLSKKIEVLSKDLENNIKSKNCKSFLNGTHSIECILLSLKISPDKKDLIKEYIETPFFKALTRKKTKNELKEILKEVALSITEIPKDDCEKTAVKVLPEVQKSTINSLFEILNSCEFSSEQKFVVKEFSRTQSFLVLFDFYKRIFEGKIPKNIIEELLNEFVSALCLYNLNSSEEFYKSLNELNRVSSIDISKLYSRLAFKKSISNLFKNAAIEFKLKIIEELFIDVETPNNLSVSAYEEFDLNTGYLKNYWNNEQKMLFSQYIKNEKALNGFSEYLLIKKLFNLNNPNLNDDKTVFESLGFNSQTILEVLDKEMDDLEFKTIFKNYVNNLIFLESDKQYINDPFKKQIFQHICCDLFN